MKEYNIRKKRTIPLIALIIATMLLMTVSFMFYASYVSGYENSRINHSAFSGTRECADSINKTVSVFFDLLGRYAPYAMAAYSEEQNEAIPEVSYPCLAAGVAAADGTAHFSDSSEIDFSGLYAFSEAASGNNSSELISGNRLAVFIPAFDDSGKPYVVVGLFSVNTLIQYSFSENAPYILCSGDSTVIYSGTKDGTSVTNPPETGNELLSVVPQSTLQKALPDMDISAIPPEKLISELSESYPVINLSDVIMTVAPVKSCGLYAVGFVTASALDSSGDIFSNTRVFIIICCVSYLLLVCFVVYSELSYTKQIASGVTASAIDKKRLGIALTNVSCLVFEYSPRSDVLDISFVSEDFPDVLPGKREHFMSEYINLDKFPAETREKLKLMLNKVSAGSQNVCEIVKVRLSAQNDHRWFRLTMSKAYETKKHGVLSVVGTLQDVHAQIEKEMNLTDLAEKDQLTSLYNRITSERIINAYLKGCHDFEGGAFMLCDLDNFKFINDTYGHSFGDAVLVTFSSMLGGAFRSSDILCRVGGDEFAVLIKGLRDPEEAVRKAEALRNRFFNRRSSGKMQTPISCSIGITMLSPADSFATLYDHADNALYSAKSKGKNHVCIYSEPQRLAKETPDEAPFEN